MPLAEKRKRRALEADGADSTELMQRLLSIRNLSKQQLAEVIATLRENPELLECNGDDVKAAGGAIFESVKRTHNLGGNAPWVFCGPNLLMARRPNLLSKM